MIRTHRCWCGHSNLRSFSPMYLRCEACETLLLANMPEAQNLLVEDDERAFYGKKYFLTYQEEEYGYPGLAERVRSDLAERCLYWLRTVLKYRLPPGTALELGCAHGGFVALLRWAGFTASGLELSPWIAQFASKTFGIPMLTGPLEKQRIEPGSLDVIALMDVMEHLHDPAGTMKLCLELLTPQGILIIQTPRYPEGRGYDEMRARNDPFLDQLKAREHLYLFSTNSIRQFFHRLDACYLEFEPAIFARYDMCLVVGRSPLKVNATEEVERLLASAPSGRVMQALLDLEKVLRNTREQFDIADSDRVTRLEIMERLNSQLAASESDRVEQQVVIERQHKEVIDLQLQTQKLEEASRSLHAQVAGLESDCAAKQLVLERQQEEIIRSQDQLQRQAGENRELRMEVETLLDQRSALQGDLTVLQMETQRLRSEHNGEMQNLEDQNRILQEQCADLEKLTQKLGQGSERLKSELSMAKSTLHRIGASRVYRTMRRLGRWDWLDEALSQVLRGDPMDHGRDIRRSDTQGVASLPGRRLGSVAVDLTPLLPGGENGGAKLVAMDLVRYLSQLEPECEWILLTSNKSHEELAVLDSPNVRRLCVSGERDGKGGRAPALRDLATRGVKKVAATLPPNARNKLKPVFLKLVGRPAGNTLARELGAQLLFCPFTAPFYYDPHVPLVSVIYDMQYQEYPQFFAPDELYHRDKYVREACRVASRLICISDFVRSTVLEKLKADPKRVVTIYIQLFDRLKAQSQERVESVLKRWRLRSDRFLLYPANFWPHKNHQMLLTALGIYIARNPRSDLKLACTGSADGRMDMLNRSVEIMGLGERVAFLGFLPDDEFASLLQSCRALVFPSLYEGFGMPVLEAMRFARPVLCSKVTSLPEIAGDAALIFDPRKPLEIVRAIEKIENDSDLVARLIERGHQRRASFGDAIDMARRYLQIFREVLGEPPHFADSLQGVYTDGWTSDRVFITYETSAEPRHLEITLNVPSWLPYQRVSIRIGSNGNGRGETHTLDRGREVTIRYAVRRERGFVELLVAPVFQPSAEGMNEDTRRLGCVCKACKLVYSTYSVDLLDSRDSVL